MTLSASPNSLNRYEQRILNLLHLFNRTRYPLLLKDLVRITQWDDESLSRCCTKLTELGLLRRISAHKGWLLTRLGKNLLLDPASILGMHDSRPVERTDHWTSQDERSEFGKKTRVTESLCAGADDIGIIPSARPTQGRAKADGIGIIPSPRPTKECAGVDDIGIIPSALPTPGCAGVDDIGIIPSPCQVQGCAGVDDIGIIPSLRQAQEDAGNGEPINAMAALEISVNRPENTAATMIDPGVNHSDGKLEASQKTGLLTKSCKSPARGRNNSDSQDCQSRVCLKDKTKSRQTVNILTDKTVSDRQTVYILTDKTESDRQMQVGKIPTLPERVAFSSRLPFSPTPCPPNRRHCGSSTQTRLSFTMPGSIPARPNRHAHRQAPRHLPQSPRLPGSLHGPAP
jgi:hypothetical protein